jgi:hypothetical protein
MPSARGVYMVFFKILMNIPLIPPFLAAGIPSGKGEFTFISMNRTQVINVETGRDELYEDATVG